MAQPPIKTKGYLPEELFPLSSEQWRSALDFRKKLLHVPPHDLQRKVDDLYSRVSATIDCTTCGNCCRSLHPAIKEEEVSALASKKSLDTEGFKNRYLENQGEVHYMKSRPCTFLNGCKCSVYVHRPESCRDYPHLSNGLFKYKASVWEQYGICPIVYFVIEELKQAIEIG